MYKTRLKFIAISVFLLGLISVGVSYGVYNETNQNLGNNQKRDIKILYRSTWQPSGDATPHLMNTHYRLQRENGSWKETITNYAPDGSILQTYDSYAINGKGIVAVDEKNKVLNFHADRPVNKADFSESVFKSSANFVGETQLLGLRTLVQRAPNGDSGMNEFYVSPDLNGLLIKFVQISKEGARVMEATAIKVEPISDAEFGMVPNYPVNFNSYKNNIKAVESTGQTEKANQMRQVIPPNQR